VVEMKQPSKPWMKFYPSDWQSDPALRMCSLAARGFWIECMVIMHKSDDYGMLLINGKKPSNSQLGILVGASENEVKELLLDLENSGVFSINRNGVIYSRRMVRDEIKSRKNRDNGKLGGNPSLSKQTIKTQSDNPPLKTQRLEARGQRLETRKEEEEKRYKYSGKIISLTAQDYDRWADTFYTLDLKAELLSLDEYYSDAGVADWFVRTSSALRKRHNENLQNKPPEVDHMEQAMREAR
jgi:hypothetical protein